MKDKIENLKAELPRGIRIVPATKTVPPETVNLLPEAGIFEAGENKVQELLEKFDKVQGINWHFIGNLQTNKVKYIVDKVIMIQSVDRKELAEEINKRCAKIGKVMDVLIEINIGREPSKGGVMMENFDELKDFILQKSNLKLKGIMSVLPIGAPEQLYSELKSISTALKREVPDADIISAGMSDDYAIAVRCGANMIRPGSMLFGKRNYAKTN